MTPEGLLHRFLDYVRIDTTADETAANEPSSPGQLELGRRLVTELQESGLPEAHQDRYGLVWATIPEIGTIRSRQIPFVVLTSNRTRELHDALKRR